MKKETKLLLLALLSVGLYAFGSYQGDAIDDLAVDVGFGDAENDTDNDANDDIDYDQYDFSDDESGDSLSSEMSRVSSNSSIDGYREQLQDGYDGEHDALVEIVKQRDRLQKRFNKLNCFGSDEDFSTKNGLGRLWKKMEENQEELECLQQKETDLLKELADLKKITRIVKKIDALNKEIENRQTLLDGRELSMTEVDGMEDRE